MLNSYPHYNRYNNYYNYTNSYNPTFYSNLQNNSNSNNIHMKDNYIADTKNSHETKDEENPEHSQKEEPKQKTKNRTIPFSISDNTLSLFGFNIAIDDLLIIGIILILLLDSECNYALIIVLGLMFFNISFSNLNLFS